MNGVAIVLPKIVVVVRKLPSFDDHGDGLHLPSTTFIAVVHLSVMKIVGILRIHNVCM